MGYRLVLLFVALIALPLQAAIIDVPQDFPTIQAAINTASGGDTVLVAPGTYFESLTISISLCLKSQGGPDVTRISPPAVASRIIHANGANSTKFILSGFTLSNAAAVDFAVYINGPSFLVENNIIANNTQCASLVINGPTGKVLYNRVSNNTGNSGSSGIWIGQGTGVEVAYNEVFENSNSDCSGIRLESGAGPSLLHHNVVRNNFSNRHDYAAAVNVNGTWNVHNNTIVANESSQPTAALWIGGSSTDVRNNIVALNQNCSGIRGATSPDYNDAFGNSGPNLSESGFGDGNISISPDFVDAPSNDFHLSPYSPCIDAGDPDPLYYDFNGTRNDMGALPYFPAGYPIATIVNFGIDAPNNVVPTFIPTVYWTYSDTGSLTQTGYEIEVGGENDWSVAEFWQSGQILSDANSAVYEGMPLVDHHRYFLRIRLSNGIGWGEWSQTAFTIRASAVVRVPEHFPEIQTAIDAAHHRDTILVSPGVYTGGLTVGRPMTILAVSSIEPTIIEPLYETGELFRSTYAGLDSMILQGFTLRGARNVSQVIFFGNSPYRIENNRITDNLDCVPLTVSSSRGGIIRGNDFFANRGTNCGSMSVSTGPKTLIERNLVHHNEASNCPGVRLEAATDSDFRFNIIYENSSRNTNAANALNINGGWRIRNNTVAENSALSSTAAVWVGNASIDVRNNIIAFNRGCYGLRDAQGAAYNNCYGNGLGEFQNCTFGPGNLSSNPLFLDTSVNVYVLTVDSPCVDAGDPNPLFDDPDGTRSDIGAFQALPAPQLTDLGIAGALDLYHVLDNTPTFTWRFIGNSNSVQTNIEIAVGTDNNWQYAEMWNPAPIATSDTFLVYNGAPLLDGRSYWMRLRAVNNLGWTGWNTMVFHLNIAPVTPQLKYPVLDVNVPTLHPTFVLRNMNDLDGDSLLYFVEISVDSLISNPMLTTVRKSLDSLTLFVPDWTLIENTRYFWRARSSDYHEMSPFSSISAFSINSANSAPAPFDLLAPSNSFYPPLATTLPTLHWSKSLDIDPLDQVNYTLLLAADSNFSFVDVTSGIVAESLAIVESLDWSEKYWWKVKAQDLIGAEIWSSQVFQFRTMTPGDNDGNGVVNITDIVYVINFLFAGGPLPVPQQAGDVNCDSKFNIADAVYLINFMFGSGPEPCTP